MSDQVTIYSADKKSVISINKGELISYQVNNIEILHQKGDPGWGNTEIEMFPIIGATKENNFLVKTPKKEAKLDQHGILRALLYRMNTIEDTKVSYSKKYIANTQVSNPKFPKKSTQEFLDWPYDFQFIKTFKLTNESLKIHFEIQSEKDMPFMLGFHPAFKVYDPEMVLKSENQKISLKDVLQAGASAFLLKDSKEVTLQNNGNLKLIIKTKGFRHIMLWTEVNNMICIEPITFYPAGISASKLHTEFDYSSGLEQFEIVFSAKPS
ncbi:aldose 1-epimerase [Aquimarina muelleri]|uniref:aldose epimerase family protein n=1 Tax=Aquimarina muelleri TaxID=279356 RepID=UPI003F683468